LSCGFAVPVAVPVLRGPPTACYEKPFTFTVLPTLYLYLRPSYLLVPYYGDISGDFRGLLNDSRCEFCIVVVAGGRSDDCIRCPKRTVRRIETLDEAHWSDLEPVEKRRFVDCLFEICDEVHLGYALITERDIQRLPCSYRIYQNSVTPAWDIALRAFAYTEILFEWVEQYDSIQFYPDRFAAPTQRETLVDLTTDILTEATVQTGSAKQRQGIQLADCIAGAIRDERLDNASWGQSVTDLCTGPDKGNIALAQLEHWLDEQ
jgi:hypothetical protein